MFSRYNSLPYFSKPAHITWWEVEPILPHPLHCPPHEHCLFSKVQLEEGIVFFPSSDLIQATSDPELLHWWSATCSWEWRKLYTQLPAPSPKTGDFIGCPEPGRLLSPVYLRYSLYLKQAAPCAVLSCFLTWNSGKAWPQARLASFVGLWPLHMADWVSKFKVPLGSSSLSFS